MLTPPHCLHRHAHIKPHFPDVLEALKTLAETIECVLTVVILYNNARWIRATFVPIKALPINTEVLIGTNVALIQRALLSRGCAHKYHNFRLCSVSTAETHVLARRLWLTVFVVGLGGVG
jgi:hypothetical protein